MNTINKNPEFLDTNNSVVITSNFQKYLTYNIKTPPKDADKMANSVGPETAPRGAVWARLLEINHVVS